MLRVGPSGIDTGAHDLGLPTGQFQEPGGLEAAIVRLVEESAQRMVAGNRLFAQIVDEVRGQGAGGELDFCAPGTLADVQKALAEACGNTSPPPGPAPEAAKTGVNH